MSQGVHFPSNNTTATARSIVAKALHPVSPIVSHEAANESDWRMGFGEYFRYMVQAGLDSPEAARSIAGAGLASLHEEMRFNQQPLANVIANPVPAFEFGTKEVRGLEKPSTTISVPYRGQSLQGSQLIDQLRSWRGRGMITGTFETAVEEVLDHPEWLSLEGDTVVLLGALAETGPLRYLLTWGADVIAVDLPTQVATRQLTSLAESGAGRVRLPVRPESLEGNAPIGANVTTELPELAAWLSGFSERLTLGHYYYTESAAHLQLAAAADALNQIVMARKPDTGAAYLLSPTGSFAVGAYEIGFSTRAYAQEKTLWRFPARLISGGRLMQPNYPDEAALGICDSTIPQQGPYYSLSKQIQRWRAAMATAEGRDISVNVAPLAFTKSLTSSKALMAACTGATRFGIEVLEPETSQALMAIMLVHDLRAGRRRHREPWREELNAAVHNGLWTSAYSPRSVLTLAAVAGIGAGPHR